MKIIKNFVFTVLSLLAVGCSGVGQIQKLDISNLDEIAKTKAIVFVKVVPKNKDLVTSNVGLQRLGLVDSVAVKERAFHFDDTKGFFAEPTSDYFVLVIDPVGHSEAIIITSVDTHHKTAPVGENRGTHYRSGCGGIENLNNIRVPVTSSGLYDFGVISYEDHVSAIGEVTFQYDHKFDESSLKSFIKTQYPTLAEKQLKPIAPVKFINRTNCPGPQTITIYM